MVNKHERRRRCRDECRKRRVPGDEGGCEPDHPGEDARHEVQGKQRPHEGRNAFAAFKFEPDSGSSDPKMQRRPQPPVASPGGRR